MRTPLSFLALIAFVAVPSAAFADGLSIGDSIPAEASTVKMKSVDESEVSIESVAGDKGTLVIFTCNHCPYVKAWDERIAKIGNDAKAQGIGVIAINANDPVAYPDDGFEPMQKRAESLGLDYPYTVDETSGVAKAFGATKTPDIFLFDGAGKLVYKGAPDDNSEDASKVTKTYLADAVAALVEGKDIPVAETKALGCSIKWRK